MLEARARDRWEQPEEAFSWWRMYQSDGGKARTAVKRHGQVLWRTVSVEDRPGGSQKIADTDYSLLEEWFFGKND